MPAEATPTGQEPAGETTPPATPATPATGTAPGSTGEPGKTFTQEDVNRISGEVRTSAKKTAVNDLFTELGVENKDSLANIIAKANDDAQANMTELQKVNTKVTELEPFKAQAADLETRNTALEGALKTHLDALKKELDIPDHVLPLVADMDPAQQLTYFSENRAAFSRKLPPNTNADGKGGKPPVTPAEKEKKAKELEARYGIYPS